MRQYTNHHWFRWWLVTWPVPSNYLNQCWNAVNWTIVNKLQWKLNRNSYIFVQENAFEMSSGKWWPFCFRPQCDTFTHIRIASVALGPSYDYFNTGEIILKNMWKTNCYWTTTHIQQSVNSLRNSLNVSIVDKFLTRFCNGLDLFFIASANLLFVWWLSFSTKFLKMIFLWKSFFLMKLKCNPGILHEVGKLKYASRGVYH